MVNPNTLPGLDRVHLAASRPSLHPATVRFRGGYRLSPPCLCAALAGSAHCLYPDVATAVSSMKLTTFGKLAAAGGVSLDSPTWVGTAFLPAETVREGRGRDRRVLIRCTEVEEMRRKSSLC